MFTLNIYISLNTMPRSINIEDRISEIKEILKKYGGIPSQTVDKSAHAKIKYFIKSYAEDVAVQSLIEEFDLNKGERKRSSFEEKLLEIQTLLKQYGKIPSVNEDSALYREVRYFFKKYADMKEVDRLKYIYADGSCYPLDESREKRPQYDFGTTLYIGRPSDYSVWKSNTAFDYIKYVFVLYSELPGQDTKPMIEFKRSLDKWYRFQDPNKKEFKSLVIFLVENGCCDENILQIYNSFKFNDIRVQEYVNKLLVKHGACTIHYIAQKAIPNCPLHDDFVFYYYYNLLNDSPKFKGISPLGELFSNADCNTPLYVHYRNYHLCEVEEIKRRVLCQNRNWDTNPPQTLDEWEAYGEYLFFIPYKNSDWRRDSFFQIDKTFPQKCFETGIPYFRYYEAGLKYLDYKLFLLEKGFELKQLKKDFDFKYISVLSLADECRLENEQDIVSAYNATRLSRECIVDKDGGVYLNTEEGLALLFFPLNAEFYAVREDTDFLCENSLCTCLNSIKTIKFGGNIRRVSRVINPSRSIDACKKIEHIIIPIYKLKEYCEIFPCKSTSFFCDYEMKGIQPQPIYEGSTLLWVPYVENFRIKEGTTEIYKLAFYGSGVTTLYISGTIREIQKNLYLESSLRNVVIEEGVEKLWGSVFWHCGKLCSVTLPDSLESLYNTFEECISLQRIHLKKNLSYIGYNVFKGCIKLSQVQIDGHLEHLGRGAFAECISLRQIEFNYGIDYIEEAFEGCKNLEHIYFKGDYESFGYGFGRFNDCLSLKGIHVPKKYYELFASNIKKQYLEILIAEDY